MLEEVTIAVLVAREPVVVAVVVAEGAGFRATGAGVGEMISMASVLLSVNAETVVVPDPLLMAHDIGSAPAETGESEAPML